MVRARRRDVSAHERSFRDEELALQRRGVRWVATTATTWPIWALTGAPTGLPHATADHHHLVATLGIWPLYFMIGGLADVARRARRLYVERGWPADSASDALDG